MIYLFLFFYTTILLFIIDYDFYDLQVIIKNKLFQNIYKYTYYGLIEPIKKCGYDYSISKYILHSIIIGGGTSLLFYCTTYDLRYSVMIMIVVSLIIPYIYFLNIKTDYFIFIEENIFIYSTNIIIYLKENKVVSEVLLLTSDNVENPIKDDIYNLVLYINDTNNFNEALDRIEKKYQYSILKNVHILLKNARDRGFNNENLYDYTFNSIEEYQILINNYRIKKQTNKKLFYFMTVLDIAGVLFLIKMFAESSFINSGDSGINFSIFIFYLLNIITVIYYETFCLRINSIEKGITL
jgi:hypothetical protein